MAERIQKSKPRAKREAVVQEAAAPAEQRNTDDIDSLLDEIDAVLEENAEEFVKGYVQKGGQIARTAWENVKGGFRETVLEVWRGQGVRVTPLR